MSPPVSPPIGPPVGPFEVTNINDSGPGSLRQAVADANLAPGADTITFAVVGTIRLTTGALTVTTNLTVEGPGPLLTISGNRMSRIFTVGTLTGGGTGSALNISNLTLTDGTTGSNGGAIENFGGTVDVTDVMFVRNSAFAGGAIENAPGGTLRISNSTFTGNSGSPGGAIANNRGATTIVNSTFVGNSAVVGGAIYNLSVGTIRVTNSTFSGNTASAEGAALHGAGGLAITVENSVFAGNGCVGPTDGGGNLDWPASGCPGVNADPRLGPLADNGGPTQTMAIGLGGGAIDAALAAACPSTDQRGVSRPQGTGCDIGAFESDAIDTTPPVITTPGDIVVDATGPTGAVVAYPASAIDDVDGSVAVTCSPPPGSTFPIGTTDVTCGASDAAGNEASGSFDVHVKSAGEQLDDLIDLVSDIGPGSSLTEKLTDARSALAVGNETVACAKLAAFANQAKAQSGKTLTPAEAAEFVATANRIRSALGC